jgi:hypothetical protein
MEPMDSSWIVVDEREGVGRVDTWSEYLCVSRTDEPDTFDIAICRYEVVGEIPAEWFDEDGCPLVEYSDGDGNLLVPEWLEEWGHYTKLTGHNGEYLLGELSCEDSYCPPITLKFYDRESISQSLNDLRWISTEKSILIDKVIQKATGS